MAAGGGGPPVVPGRGPAASPVPQRLAWVDIGASGKPAGSPDNGDGAFPAARTWRRAISMSAPRNRPRAPGPCGPAPAGDKLASGDSWPLPTDAGPTGRGRWQGRPASPPVRHTPRTHPAFMPRGPRGVRAGDAAPAQRSHLRALTVPRALTASFEGRSSTLLKTGH